MLTKDLLWSEELDLFKETETVAREESESNVIFVEKKSGQGSNALERRTKDRKWWVALNNFQGSVGERRMQVASKFRVMY